MLYLESIQAWDTQAFENVLKHELERLDISVLPLQQGLSQSSYVDADSFQVMIINVWDDPEYIRAKAGIFYTGIIPGCSCTDDPAPAGDYSEYCELRFDINKATGETRVTLLTE